MTKDDLKRIEKQADICFEKGQIVGKKARRLTRILYYCTIVVSASIIASIFFFVYGFFDHNYKKKL
jgi:hypothetical protein